MVTKGYGITIDDIDWSCPADLEPYNQAYNMQLEALDRYAHAFCGVYIENAVAVAVERCLAGKKARLDYIKDPLLKEAYEKATTTEEERMKKEIEKAILIEQQWAQVGIANGLPEIKLL